MQDASDDKQPGTYRAVAAVRIDLGPLWDVEQIFHANGSARTGCQGMDDLHIREAVDVDPAYSPPLGAMPVEERLQVVTSWTCTWLGQ